MVNRLDSDVTFTHNPNDAHQVLCSLMVGEVCVITVTRLTQVQCGAHRGQRLRQSQGAVLHIC